MFLVIGRIFVELENSCSKLFFHLDITSLVLVEIFSYTAVPRIRPKRQGASMCHGVAYIIYFQKIIVYKPPSWGRVSLDSPMSNWSRVFSDSYLGVSYHLRCSVTVHLIKGKVVRKLLVSQDLFSLLCTSS